MNHNPAMLPKVRSKLIMSTANGKPCTARISGFYPGYGCTNHPTTVGGHLPIWGKGTSTKVTDMAVAFVCQNCHDIIDGRDRKRRDYIIERYPTAYMERLLHALTETHALLIEKDVIVIPDGEII